MRLGFAFFGALFVSLPGWAQDAAAWMARMNQALNSLDYHGDLVYAHGGQIETLSLFHAAGPDGVRERLVSTSGAPREVIREGGKVTCVGTGRLPSAYGEVAATPLLGTFSGDEAALTRHYALALAEGERVAGHATQRVEVRPRDAFRYGYRIWLEQGTGLPLKSVRFGADGRAVEQILFTRVALGERPADSDLGAPTVAGTAQNALIPPQAVTSPAPGWQVADAPAGFALRLQQPPSRDGSTHLVYSDGLANVSVYVEPLQRDVPAFSGPASRGALNLYGRVVDGRQITVLGDVPAATVERFAQGVTASGG